MGRVGKVRHLGHMATVCASMLVLCFVACDTKRDPELDESVETPPPVPPAPPVPEVLHTLTDGETLWDVARTYDTTVDRLMADNNLTARDVRRLREGRGIRVVGATEAKAVIRAEPESLPELSDGAYHRLARGETLWDVARTYDLSLDTLIARNELDEASVRNLREGAAIIVPGLKPAQIESTRAQPQKRDGIVHTMAHGETIWDLASSFQVSVAELMAANQLTEEDTRHLREGRRLFVPGASVDQRGRAKARTTPRQRRALTIAERLGLGTRQVASQLLGGRVKPNWVSAAGGSRLPGYLRWPVTKGRYVRGYGSGEQGYHLAVDIAGDVGWNVRAAAPGIVAYSGNEVRGYGNMVLVVHPGGWVTMYAHNSMNFVVAGEKVPRGGILAELGSTGISRGPHVHFEFMYGGKNCDPAVLFRPGVRHGDERLSPLPYTTWRNAKQRPSRVACAPRKRHPRSQWVVNE